MHSIDKANILGNNSFTEGTMHCSKSGNTQLSYETGTYTKLVYMCELSILYASKHF